MGMDCMIRTDSQLITRLADLCEVNTLPIADWISGTPCHGKLGVPGAPRVLVPAFQNKPLDPITPACVYSSVFEIVAR